MEFSLVRAEFRSVIGRSFAHSKGVRHGHQAELRSVIGRSFAHSKGVRRSLAQTVYCVKAEKLENRILLHQRTEKN